MSNLTEKAQWEPGIYQLETSDPVLGGPDGVDNRQAKQLANRSLYLKEQVEAHAKAADPHSQYAPKASPTFSGTPGAPTAAVDNSTTQIATTAFVLGQLATAVPPMAGVAAVGTSKRFARQDHIHPTDTTRAPLTSPALTGTPTTPNPAFGANTQQIASTAFVMANTVPYRGQLNNTVDLNTLVDNGYWVQNISANASTARNYPLNSAGMLRVVRYDVLTFQVYQVHMNAGVWYRTYYSGAWQPWRLMAFCDSPTFSGTPTAPTAAAGTNNAQLATTAFVQQGLATLRSLAANQVRNVAPTGIPKAALSAHFVSRTGLETGGTGVDYGDLLTLNTYSDPTGGYINALFLSKRNSGDGQAIYHYRASIGDTVWANPKRLAYTDSPDLTGTPTAPTPATDTSTTQLATTAFVLGQAGTAAPKMNGAPAAGISKRFAREDHVHGTDTSRAPLASPSFSGTPTAPTPAAGSNNQQLANTAWVLANAIPDRGPIAAGTDLNGITNTGIYIQNTASNATSALNYPATYAGMLTVYTYINETFQAYQELLTRGMWYRSCYNGVWDAWRKIAYTDSPAFSGIPTAPTAAAGTKTAQIATTAFVATAVANLVGAAPGTLDTLAELANALGKDPNFATTVTKEIATKAPLASPALSGTPTAPTAAADTGSQQLATTAFVLGQASDAAPAVNGIASAGTAKRFARADHIHGTDNTRAPLVSPAFSGTPTAPTAGLGASNAQLANAAFVRAASRQFANIISITSGQTLGAIHVGKLLVVSGTAAPIALVLPDTAALFDGAPICVANLSAATVTLQRAGTRDTINAAGVTSLALLPGDTAELCARPTSSAWVVTGGSAQLQLSSAFGATLAPVGSQRIGGGAILKWGYANFSASEGTVGTVNVFPIAFPNECFLAVASDYGRSGPGGICQAFSCGEWSPRSFRAWSRQNGSYANAQGRYIAIGW